MDSELMQSLKETIIMVSIPTIFSFVFGVFLGTSIYLKDKFSYIANTYANIVRSIPYLLFVVIVIPLSRVIFGTAFGVIPSTLPLIFVGIGIYSRFVEQSFLDVNQGIKDLAKSMKVTKFQLVVYFLIPEALPSLVLGITSTIISLISYSTVMGIVGGGGIGDYAIRYGYYEFNMPLIYKAIIYMIVLVFLIQIIGGKIAKLLDKKGR